MSIKVYDVDVAQFIADQLKVKLNLVSVTGQNRIPHLTEKRVEILLSSRSPSTASSRLSILSCAFR